jgi:hypothetical protein
MKQFIIAHQVLFTLGAAYVWSSFISALPAPTATSSTFYQFAFKFLNVLAANIARARNNAVESSPNWTDALAKAAVVSPVNRPTK